MITSHPFLDSNGPSYMYGPCDHRLCAKNVKHDCPHTYCGKAFYEHEFRITVTGFAKGKRKIVRTKQ